MILHVKDNILYESILTARCKNGLVATPVGFIKRGNIIEVKVYKNTALYEALRECSTVVLNFTHDPRTFILLAFKREFGIDEHYLHELLHKDEGGILRLRDCVGYVVAHKMSVDEHDNYIINKYKIEELKPCTSPTVEPFTRCYSQLIEAAIYASKVKFVDSERKKLYMFLIMNFLSEIVNKTCSSEYARLLEELKVITQRWLREE